MPVSPCKFYARLLHVVEMNLDYNLFLCSGGQTRNIFAKKEKRLFPTGRGQWCSSKKNYFYREPHGIHCQNPAHLGSAAALNVESDFCERCVKSGGSFTNQYYWTLPKLIYIPSTCPIFFVVLVSRNSKRNIIANSMYADLNETILENHR